MINTSENTARRRRQTLGLCHETPAPTSSAAEHGSFRRRGIGLGSLTCLVLAGLAPAEVASGQTEPVTGESVQPDADDIAPVANAAAQPDADDTAPVANATAQADDTAQVADAAVQPEADDTSPVADAAAQPEADDAAPAESGPMAGEAQPGAANGPGADVSAAQPTTSVREAAPRPEEIVVTATRAPRRMRDVPAAVSSVTTEDLKNMRMLGVKEALTGLAGVQSETRNGGYDARLIIRGAGLKARYGIREIMVLLDGVPITDPDGLSRLDFVDSQLIERVDVIRGPSSTLYGANAAGGVVNIVTTDPFDEIQSVKLGLGDQNTQLYNVILGTHVGETFVTVTGTRKTTDSWRRWNRFESDQWGLKVGHRLDDLGLVELNVYYTQADLRLPGTLSFEEWESDPTQRTSQPFQHSGRYSNVLTTYLKSQLDLGVIELEPRVYVQRWEHRHPVTGFINDGGALVAGIDLQGNVKHSLLGMQGVLTLGTAGQIDDGEGKKYTYRDTLTESVPFPPPGTERLVATLSDAKGDLAETSSSRIGKWGVYAQESLRPIRRLIVDAGVRFDQVLFGLHRDTKQEFNWGSYTYIPAEGESDRDPRFHAFSPRLGLAFEAHPMVSLYGNLATGFQTPQSGELEDNTELTPSHTTSVEAGVKARLPGGHSIDAAVYHMRVEDEIVQARQPDETVAYSNAGETVKRGLELSANVRPVAGLRLGGTYAYSDFRFGRYDEPVRVYDPARHGMVTEVHDRSGNQLPYVPRHQYSLFASLEHSTGFRAVVRAYTWGEYYVDSANSDAYGGYTLLTSVLLGWEDEHWGVTLDVANVFDQRYAMEVTKAGDELRVSPGAPRSFYASVAYRL